MPTETIPTFQAISGVEGEPQFVVSYPHGGVVYVVGFDSFMDLLNIVASYKDRFKRPLPNDLINMIVDFAEESMEWNDQQQTYPLGVTYIGEAVCDFAPPDYDPQTVAFRHVEPSPFWEWAAATLRVGAVVAPWAFLMLLCRLAYAKAAGWGW